MTTAKPKSKSKRQKPQPLDFFAVRLSDGTFGLGQLREVLDDESIVLYGTRAESPEALADLSLKVTSGDAVGVLFICTRELARGDWQIIGNAGDDRGVSALHRPRQGTSYVGEVVDDFLEAFHGLQPWDESEWNPKILLPTLKPPPNRMMRDAPEHQPSRPAPRAPSPIPEAAGQLHVEILYEGAGLPDVPLLRKRQALEAWIESEGLGEVTDAGGGGGVLDVFIQTKDARRAAAAIEGKLVELGWQDVSSIAFEQGEPSS